MPHTPLSLQMPLFCRSSYQTTLMDERAALLPLTSYFHTVFRAPSSASTRKSLTTHTLQTTHENTPRMSARAASSRAPTRRAGRDVVATSKSRCRAAKPSRGRLRASCYSAESGGRRPSALAPQPREEIGERPQTRPPPAPRDAALTGEKGLAAAAQRQPREGQDGGEGGRLHGRRPPGRTALAGGSPRAPGAEAVADGRERAQSAGSGGPTACVL